MGNDMSALDNVCFFIAPIGEEGTPERARSDDVLNGIVEPAAQDLGLSVVRGDMISESGQITQQVLDHVLYARVAVADLTGLNPNVFYELGVRHNTKRPVVLIAEKGCRLPFDIAQMRTIFFGETRTSAQQCRRAIVKQLTEQLASGTADSPIQVGAGARAPAAGTAIDRQIAELASSVAALARHQEQTSWILEHISAELRNGDHERRGQAPPGPVGFGSGADPGGWRASGPPRAAAPGYDPGPGPQEPPRRSAGVDLSRVPPAAVLFQPQPPGGTNAAAAAAQDADYSGFAPNPAPAPAPDADYSGFAPNPAPAPARYLLPPPADDEPVQPPKETGESGLADSFVL